MSPPTLFQLAAKSLAQGIHQKRIPFDFNLDAKSSNAVVRELLELNTNHIKKLKTHKNQLSTLTELDLRKCQIDEEGVLNLKNFKLHSLEFGHLWHLKTKFPDPSNPNGIDIVCLLEKALNTNSQKMMVHLGFSGSEQFMSGWEEKVSKLFPSLQSMQIKHKEFNERFQLSHLCNFFPNLCYLDISSAKGLSTLNGIKNLKNLQKLVMSDVKIRDIDGYKELSELKNLKVLDVSGEGRFYISDLLVPIPVIRHLLTAEVRMESLELLDCSMTIVQEQDLRRFVENHPKLKTVVAISTACDNLSIPTIDLLNFISPTSFAKCLKYAITNERNNSAQMCIKGISKKLNTIHRQLNDSEIIEFINALCYASTESKDQKTKYWAIKCFHESRFFETERFFSSFSLEIPRIVESISNSYDNLKQFCRHARHCLWSIFNRILGFFRFGRTLQDRLFNLTVEKTLELLCQRSRNDGGGTQILETPGRFISVDTAMCNNTKVMKWLFAFANKLARWESSYYQRIIELIASLMKEASEETLKSLVSNGQIVENCIEQFMIISDLPTKDTQKDLLHFLLVFAPVMSDEQLEKCYGGETLIRLMGVINTKGFRNPFEETRALLLCSILSLLLAKNLTNHRECITMKIKEFGNSWGQLNIPGCHEMSGKLLKALVNSIHSTVDSICCCLILMSTFIYTEGYEADGLWNFMKTTLEGIRDNQNMAEYARNAAEAVLYEMERIENKYKI